VKVAAQFAEPVNSADMGVPVHQVKEFSPRLSFGCSISHPAYVALGLLDYPQALREVARTWPHIANYYAMTAGGGHGTVRCLGLFGTRLCFIICPKRTCGLWPKGCASWRNCCSKPERSTCTGNRPCWYRAVTQGSTEVAEILPRFGQSDDHSPVFLLPHGEDPRRCATDSFGRVRGRTVCLSNDASLLCTAPGVNPQGTIMALARRNALHFLNRL
jgi:hypothetical protein